MSKNHGTISFPTPPPKPPKPHIPRSLQMGVLECLSGGFPYSKAVERYGLWEVVALKEVEIFGTILQKGDRAKIAGNIGVFYAQDGFVEFVDPRMAEEERVAAEAARLNLPLSAKDNPAFNRR